ncbi:MULTISPECIES: sulfate adenylyltransferase [unclassified Gilliamella]|uniref:sulfate adenylyltransferase n=1 Tax=unclassified Gilliamella TaxID=2685620 RepID=UPI001C6A8832|nr:MULTISPECIES: sulfate adenylyltransferase [unclassified Gilliamella]MCX8586240.1 sulfate adenylyltransferase [Gilliamella sp. B3562]MCX8685803.1 sulfate adenylyltransferase [Gilliamella sp. B2864]QYN43156.1 sulfate adenylyltransferase [Gilliamella sp. ESL0443]
MGLIAPHASDSLQPLQVNDDERLALQQYAKNLPAITLSSRETGDLVMLGIGGFTPLYGFMREEDWRSVCDNMHLANGVFWPIPITVSVTDAQAETLKLGDEIALKTSDGQIIGILNVDSIYRPDKQYEANQVFTTTDPSHPGVAMLMAQPPVNLGGKVRVLHDNGFKAQFGQYALTPQQTRERFNQLGWKKIAAFQTRNPMHRSHEYLVKTVLELFDGVLIHSLFGNLKPGDVPVNIRLKAINSLIHNYFVPDSVIHSGYPLDMRYAGPKEALLHALFRQNYGCSHLIVGRDHAGVRDFYSPFAAQEIFSHLQDNDLLIKPIKIDWTFYCHKCDGMASTKTCPHDSADRVLISGTEVRRRLQAKEPIPETFSRPEVVAELYQWVDK